MQLTAQVHQHRWQRPPPLPASHNIYRVCSLVEPSPAHTLGRSTGSPPPCSSAPTATQTHTLTHTHVHDYIRTGLFHKNPQHTDTDTDVPHYLVQRSNLMYVNGGRQTN